MFLRKFAHLTRLMRPADDDTSTGGGAVDRGDSFTPTLDDDEVLDAPAPKVDKAPKADKATQVEGLAELDGEAGGEDAATETDPAADDAPKRKGEPRIPLSRHEKILEKERERRQAVEAQLAQFQKGKEVANVNEELTKVEDQILALEDKLAEAQGDGDIDKSKALMRQIRQLDRQLADARADMRAAEVEARAIEQARYDVVLERIESTYNVLDPEHADYDKELVQDVVDLKHTYQRRGMTPAQALQKAVKKLVGAETRSQEQATEVTPRVSAEDVAAQRKRAAVEKTASAAQRTPPNTGKVGADSDRAGGSLRAEDVIKLGQDEFAKLDEAELKRLRGDTI